MPKSKRNKLVTLSKTKKRGKEQKGSLVTLVRGCLDEYTALYIFSFENMRNSLFKEFKDKLKTSSRFFLGSNKVLQIALGKTDADEQKEGLHKASEMIHGYCGLLFTNLPHAEVVREFEELQGKDYARTGSLATETVELQEGPLEQFTHDMEPFLRKQGMPVRLNRGVEEIWNKKNKPHPEINEGVVELVADYTVCKEGEPVSPEGSRILRLLGVQMAAFKMHLICRWAQDEFEIFERDEDIPDIQPENPSDGS